MPRHPLADLVRSRLLPPGRRDGGAELLRGAVDPAGFIAPADIRRKLALGLLRLPYVAFHRGDQEVPASEYTEKRQCVGVTGSGFVSSAAAQALLAEGVTVELRRLGDWHRAARTLAADIEASAPVAASIRAVLRGPSDPEVGLRCGPDAAAIVVAQVSGEQGWRVDAPGCGSSTLRPGDVLYLPAGHAGMASTRDEPSLHVAVELIPPTLGHLVAAARQHFVDTNADLIVRYHLVPSAMRSAAVRDRLVTCVRELPEDVWRSRALALTRRWTG